MKKLLLLLLAVFISIITFSQNHIIMITTKHNTKGVTHLDFSVDYGIQTLASTLDVCDVDQYAAKTHSIYYKKA
jgi:hypothetical protein